MNGTEAEYAKKRCHKLLGAPVIPAAPNGNGDSFPFFPVGTDDKGNTNCVGSACAGWEWVTGKATPARAVFDDTADYKNPEPPRPTSVPTTWTWQAPTLTTKGHWLEPAKEAALPRLGKCGVK